MAVSARQKIDMLQQALITGADGMVGGYVDFGYRTDHKTLDVTDLDAVRKVTAARRPPLIIHLAAATDLARCEREPDYAYRVNTVGAYNVALAAQEIGAKLVYVSTSAVFDGTKDGPYTEDDTPNPLSVYGHSKYLGELAVRGMLSDYLIVRITWVFGGWQANDKKFVGKILKQLKEPVITVVADKRGSPTYGKDAVNGIKWLVENNKRGIFHMSNAGAPTRADVVREIVAITGSRAEINETDESVFTVPYQSGKNESLKSKVSYMRPWQDALREYIKTEWTGVI